MVSGETMILYSNTFKGSELFFDFNSRKIMVNRESDGKLFVRPNGETDETIIDRIERSKQAGRNLFFEEWEEVVPPFVPDGCIS